MPQSIPASEIVSVTPSVLKAGGRALDLLGLFLTDNPRIPVGGVMPFAVADDVATTFGDLSGEALTAATYFAGFSKSNRKPGSVLFARYTLVPAAAFLRSAPVAMTLAQLRTQVGNITLTVDGATATATGINLSAANSFSAAAALIGTALGLGCAWDPLAGAFQINSATTGPASTITAATGTLAAALGFTVGSAILSQGAAASIPAAAMNAIVAQTRNWACFTTIFEPPLADKLGFAAWTSATGGRYVYAAWDTDPTAAQFGAAACFGALAGKGGANYSGVVPIYQSLVHAAFILGFAASLDFGQHNGRATAKFKTQAGLTPTVTNATAAAALAANGYNFVGGYGTANDEFTFYTPGTVGGDFQYLDSYLDEIWMSNAFQLALIVLLTEVKSIPYNDAGYALIRAACADVKNQAINFGAIRRGVTLSEAQKAEVNDQAGVKIDDVLFTEGCFLQVLDPTPGVRAARGTPQCTFWFTDGGSIHSINLASVAIQ